MNSRFEKALRKFKSEDYAYEYAESFVRRKVAGQLRGMRTARELTQEEFARLIRSGQSRVNEFEKPEYGKMSMETLFKIARALGVMVDIEFKPADRFLWDTLNMPGDWTRPRSRESAVADPVPLPDPGGHAASVGDRTVSSLRPAEPVAARQKTAVDTIRRLSALPGHGRAEDAASRCARARPANPLLSARSQ